MNACAMETEKVISHILEIIYLMTGEEYMIVKRPLLYKYIPQVLEDLCRSRNSVLEIPADSQVHLRRRSGSDPGGRAGHGVPENMEDTSLGPASQHPADGGHVQIKCDDLAMYLSVEEWEYLENHKEDYEEKIGSHPHFHTENVMFDDRKLHEAPVPPQGEAQTTAHPEKEARSLLCSQQTPTCLQDGGQSSPCSQEGHQSPVLSQDGGHKMSFLQDGSHQMPVLQDGGHKMPVLQDGGHKMPVLQDGGHNMPVLQDGGHKMSFLQDGGHKMPVLQDGGHSLPCSPDNTHTSPCSEHDGGPGCSEYERGAMLSSQDGVQSPENKRAGNRKGHIVTKRARDGAKQQRVKKVKANEFQLIRENSTTPMGSINLTPELPLQSTNSNGESPMLPDEPSMKGLQDINSSMHPQLDSEQGECNGNENMKNTNTVSWKSMAVMTPTQVSSLGTSKAGENVGTPKRQCSDIISEHKNMAVESSSSIQGRDVPVVPQNQMLNHEVLPGVFLETHIKQEQANSEYLEENPHNIVVTATNSDLVNSNSLDHVPDFLTKFPNIYSQNALANQECYVVGHITKTVNGSPKEKAHALDFILPFFSDKPQRTPLLDQNTSEDSGVSTLLDPCEDKLHKSHIKEVVTNQSCSMDSQETKISQIAHFSLETDLAFSSMNPIPDVSQKSAVKIEVTQQEFPVDDHRNKTAYGNDHPLETDELVSHTFPNIFRETHMKQKLTSQKCSKDACNPKTIKLNDSLLEGNHILFQIPNSFPEFPQRSCIKKELTYQQCSIDSLQEKPKQDNSFAPGRSTSLHHIPNSHKPHVMGTLSSQEYLLHNQRIEMANSTSNSEHCQGIHWQTPLISEPSTDSDYHYFVEEPVGCSTNGNWPIQAKAKSCGKPLKTVSCNDCGKLFSCNSYLVRHQRLHTGEKPFVCSECGKSFSWMSSLVTHKRTHFGEKPFSCKQCGKRFSDYSGVIKHRRSHTGEKPYCCLVCGERFAQTYQLVKHQAVHLVEELAEKSFKVHKY